jgi:hypothetical protein
MTTKIHSTVIGLAAAGAFWTITAIAADKLPVPPRFTAEAERMEILRNYPLGVIPQQAAFSHHGKADLEVALPNGLEGWVYEVGRKGKSRTYETPQGKERTVTESQHSRGTRTYTLVFGSNGKVVDVLYNEHGRHDGLTALQAQQQVMKRVMEAQP